MRALFFIFLVGCAGDLEHPEQFSLSSDGGACDAPSTVFKSKCTQGACHSWSGHAGKLDLESADILGRYREVAAALRARHGETCPPIIMLTSHGRSGATADLGVRAQLSKPVKPR